MKKSFPFLTILVAIALFVLIFPSLATQTENEILKRKIIVFKEGISDEIKESLIQKHKAIKLKNLDLINGKAVLLSPKTEKLLAKEKGILRIEDDVEVFALGRPTEIKVKRLPTQPPEVLPWGVDRIDADLVWTITTGDPIKVAILDTGIDLKHPDLKENLKGGVSTVWYTRSYNDDNGHGTHVAGIVAAIDNEIGVIGVGPKIDLYAVKVLDRQGSGYLSDVIEGLDWCIKNKIQVVNMSFGTPTYSSSSEEAIKKAYDSGIILVAAAGNEGPNDNTVLYPAKFNEVIAVTATDQQDNIASWSSRGPEVDLAAPGVNIYSTYKEQTYKTLSGTSMAAPHVTGVAALVLTQTQKCDFDGNGICTPAEVKQRLESTAEDLGNPGWDNLYGWGLVNAENAVAGPVPETLTGIKF